MLESPANTQPSQPAPKVTEKVEEVDRTGAPEPMATEAGWGHAGLHLLFSLLLCVSEFFCNSKFKK